MKQDKMYSDKLFIIGGEDRNFINKIDDNSLLVFLDKTTGKFQNTINLLNDFQEKQVLLRDKWLKLQEEVFNKIQPNIEKDDDYKYILTNLFFESSPYKTDDIFLFFKLFLIVSYIKNSNIKKIYLFNVTEDVAAFFHKNEDNLSVSVVNLSPKKKHISLRGRLRSNPLTSLVYRFFIETKKILLNLSPRKVSSKKCVLSYYPGHSFDNGFSSKYFADVTDLLIDDYAWLFLYVGNKSKIKNEDVLLSNNLENHSFIDAYFSFKDFREILSNFSRVRKKISLISYKNIFMFEDVDYSYIFHKDWLISSSDVLLDTLIFEKKIRNFFKVNSDIKEILYLLEFQPWESMLNKIAGEYGVATKGIVHSILRPNLMNFYSPKITHSYFYNPTFIGANCEFAKTIFLKNGYFSNQIFKIEAQRYNNISVNNTGIEKSDLKKSVLIFTSIDPLETKELLSVFAESTIVFDNIFIKEHPHLPVKSIISSSIKDFPDYELVNGSMSDAFEYADIIFTANSTSVLFESVLENKITISLISLSTLPMPAIESASTLYFIYDSNSLDDLLTHFFNEKSYLIPCSADQHVDLFINKDLPLWKHFLKI